MSDQTPTSSPIQTEATRFGSAVSQALFAKFGGDINLLLETVLPVGSLVYSMLTEAQFQSQAGAGWVLADGRNVAGSRYQSVTGSDTLPDPRGIFLRGKNNGRVDGRENPAGELDLGTFQGHAVEAHAHATGVTALQDTDPANTGTIVKDEGSEYAITTETETGEYGTSTETRPRNVTVNIFIRIN